MKLYTRTGDDGQTGLSDGTRVSKASDRVEAYGEVDELNALLGAVLATGVTEPVAPMLERIQRDLFALGARLADPGGRVAERAAKATLGTDEVTRLERWIDELEAGLPPLRHFILPGGSPAGSSLHLARAVCRRAERRMVAVGTLPRELIAYVNRLSDLLFVMARAVNQRAGAAAHEW